MNQSTKNSKFIFNRAENSRHLLQIIPRRRGGRRKQQYFQSEENTAKGHGGLRIYKNKGLC